MGRPLHLRSRSAHRQEGPGFPRGIQTPLCGSQRPLLPLPLKFVVRIVTYRTFVLSKRSLRNHPLLVKHAIPWRADRGYQRLKYHICRRVELGIPMAPSAGLTLPTPSGTVQDSTYAR
jgi:hypothetical protein